MSHFDTPSSGIKFKSLLGVNVHIRRDKGVPGAVALLVEEELNIYAGILGPDRGAGIAKGTVPLVALAFSSLFVMSGAQRLPKAVSYLVLPILIVPSRLHLKFLL